MALIPQGAYVVGVTGTSERIDLLPAFPPPSTTPATVATASYNGNNANVVIDTSGTFLTVTVLGGGPFVLSLQVVTPQSDDVVLSQPTSIFVVTQVDPGPATNAVIHIKGVNAASFAPLAAAVAAAAAAVAVAAVLSQQPSKDSFDE